MRVVVNCKLLLLLNFSDYNFRYIRNKIIITILMLLISRGSSDERQAIVQLAVVEPRGSEEEIHVQPRHRKVLALGDW